MKHTEDEVRAMIYNMSGEILMGKATEENIKAVVKLASENDLLDLVNAEFGEIHSAIAGAKE